MRFPRNIYSMYKLNFCIHEKELYQFTTPYFSFITKIRQRLLLHAYLYLPISSAIESCVRPIDLAPGNMCMCLGVPHYKEL